MPYSSNSIFILHSTLEVLNPKSFFSFINFLKYKKGLKKIEEETDIKRHRFKVFSLLSGVIHCQRRKVAIFSGWEEWNTLSLPSHVS